MITFTHTLSGRTFTASGPSQEFGPAAVEGTWDSGEAGVIWPTETLMCGTLLWRSEVHA